MWLEIVAMSVGVWNDPDDILPTLFVYILVVFDNGMHYGVPFFAEDLVGSLSALGFRRLHLTVSKARGMIVQTLFSNIVGIYA